MFYTADSQRITLRIKAQPSASRSEFAGRYGTDAIKIRLAAPAVEGAANTELIAFLAKQFKVPKRSVTIQSGTNSKIKIVAFPPSDRFAPWLESMLAEPV